ncbi:MAG: tetratricopeptide repeat protein [Vicinamibacteria bacterium]
MRASGVRAAFLAAALAVMARPATAQVPRLSQQQQPDLAPAWQAYTDGRLEEARALFQSAASLDPRRVEAHTGLGYVATRLGRLPEAAAHFDAALALEPANRDGLVGGALVDERLGDHRRALARVEQVLASLPEDPEALPLARRLRAIASTPSAEAHLPPARRATLALPMRARGRVFELRDGAGAYRPFFVKSVNLGVALPGRAPTEFPTDAALYRRWFEQMRECGFTSLRVYTILPPVFYDTLVEFNRGRPDPLRLIHGVWAEEPPDDDYAAPRFEEEFRAEIRRVIDLMHGALDLPHRPGHASGRYRSDASAWWIATILGREWEAYSVLAFNARHPGLGDFDGRFVRARRASAMERWLAAQMDYATAYEHDRWNAQRPIAWASWPTLDPLSHPTESTRAEEAAWQARLGLPVHSLAGRVNDEDAVGLDLEKLETTAANEGGLFAVYHAYPYYPDFIVNDPGYRAAADAEGPNAYIGYLRDLARHHARHPVFVGEVGVPTSREVAHVQPQGWTHGGHGERQQGEIDARLLRTVHEAGLAGAALFAWIDEWFKHNWLVMAYHRPRERNALWLDRQDAEQNYGLIAYRPGAAGPRIVIDGKTDDWAVGDRLLQGAPSAPIRALWAASDEADLFLRLDVDPAAALAYAIAIDVVDPARGDFRFPAGLDLRSRVGFEAAVLLDDRSARVVLDDTYTRGADVPEQPRANDSGTYVSPRIQPNAQRITRAGEVLAPTVIDIGALRRGTNDRRSPEYDDGAEWTRDARTGAVELRIPWGLLNVTDPSSRSVMSTGRGEAGGFARTEGLRFAVAAFRAAPGAALVAAGKAVDVLPATGVEGMVNGLPLYAWPTWEEPTFHTYPKLSFEIVGKTLRQMPDAPRTEPPPR